MYGKIAIVGWALVIVVVGTVGLALLKISLPDMTRYMRMRRM